MEKMFDFDYERNILLTIHEIVEYNKSGKELKEDIDYIICQFELFLTDRKMVLQNELNSINEHEKMIKDIKKNIAKKL